MENSKQGFIQIISLLNILLEQTEWKGPFLIVDETISEWKKRFKVRTLSLIGCSEDQKLTESNVFPVYDFSCRLLPSNNCSVEYDYMHDYTSFY